jgi:hypothetical protein
MRERFLKDPRVILSAILVPVVSLAIWTSGSAARVRAGEPLPAKGEIATLQAEVNKLKEIVPDQSHAMKDVGYHFANLWFAAEKKNWPLADFYWSETRSHLRWAVRIIPVRKDPEGREIRLQEILEPIEKTSLEEVHKAINEKNAANFEVAYKQMLDSCYACHLASGKPYLRLQIPKEPEAPIINFDPQP